MSFKSLFLSPLFVLVLLFSAPSIDARQSTDEQEVYLTFRYENAVDIYITAIYRNDEFYLPQVELFRALQIDQSVDIGTALVSGEFLDLGTYRIHYGATEAQLNSEVFLLTADDFLIRELDYFIHPDILSDIFNLNFTVDFNTLSLNLDSEHEMPVISALERERRRQQTLRGDIEVQRTYFPLRYGRDIHFINGAFIDYNLTGNFSENVSNYMFTSAVGMEVIGGDLQGTVFGNFSSDNSTLRSQNLRWQYGILDNNLISRVTIGQTLSQGLRPTSISGIQITNNPIEPRFLFDDYVLSGSSIPNSIAELYRNNSLISYQELDDSGDYRFLVPLTYGTTRYNLRIITPAGDEIDRPTRIQIPYSFNPPGSVNYSLSAGRVDNPLPGTIDRGFTGNGKAVLGIANWLSVNAGVQYFEAFNDNLPTLSGGLSTRLFSKYLVSLEAASQAFYRANASVYYANGTNLSLDYTHFNFQGGLFNPGRNQSMLRTSFFKPISIGAVPIFFRTSVSHEQQAESRITRYRVEINTILGRTNLRLRYQDSQIGRIQLINTPASRVSASARYNFSRNRSTPGIFRGLLLRGQTSFAPAINKVIDAEIQMSRRILGNGRLQATYGKNFIGDYSYFRLNLTFDFKSIRSNSSVRSSRSSVSSSQSIRGSLGFDLANGRVVTSNRQQAGKSALAVRMFVDENENGIYDDNEELINQPAVRVERAGGVVENINGINYISQLQPYRQYNLVVNKTALLNPLLVPSVEQFSFITDPNQYKVIDIPLYYSGVIEGRVIRRANDTDTPLPGVRLLLKQVQVDESVEPYTETLTTFRDGSFYAWEIPPGSYEMQLDPIQLEFLQAHSIPDTLKFDVRALAEGDFVTGLELVVVPNENAASPSGNAPDNDNSINPESPQSGSDNQLNPNASEPAPSEPENGNQLFQGTTESGPSEPDIQIDNDVNQEPNNAITTIDETAPRVQLGAFSTRVNAERYADRLLEDHGIETTLIESATSNLVLVRTLPIPVATDPTVYLNSLKALGLGEGIYLVDP